MGADRGDGGCSPGDDPRWAETDSDDFRRYGDLFVPHRAVQLRVLADLVPGKGPSFEVIELGCGEGLLSDALLERWPQARVTGLDASPAMLDAARSRTVRHGGRFRALEGRIEEIARLWQGAPPRAIVSSLAIHHLTDEQKCALFAWSARTLVPGGALLIADLVWPPARRGREVAARLWDDAVAGASGEIRRPEALETFRRDGWNMYALEQPDPEDRPASIAAQLGWLGEAGLEAVDVYWMFAGHAIFGGRAPGTHG